MTLLETEDFFDYQCPKDGNYVLLEKLPGGNGRILEGTCAKCGENFSILYEDWEEWDKKEFIKEDEEMR